MFGSGFLKIARIICSRPLLCIEDKNEQPLPNTRFDIENIADFTGQYITHIINKLETMDNRLFVYIMSDALNLCFEYFTINNNDTTINIMFRSLFIDNEISI